MGNIVFQQLKRFAICGCRSKGIQPVLFPCVGRKAGGELSTIRGFANEGPAHFLQPSRYKAKAYQTAIARIVMRHTTGAIGNSATFCNSVQRNELSDPGMLDQPAFNRNRLKAEKLIASNVLEQLVRVQADAAVSSRKRGGE